MANLAPRVGPRCLATFLQSDHIAPAVPIIDGSILISENVVRYLGNEESTKQSDLILSWHGRLGNLSQPVCRRGDDSPL